MLLIQNYGNDKNTFLQKLEEMCKVHSDQMPVYPVSKEYLEFFGDFAEEPRKLTDEEILESGLVYKDGLSGRGLAKPPAWGEKRDVDGKPYHGGIFNPYDPDGPCIAYHYSASVYS
jgi:hypothetical protein